MNILTNAGAQTVRLVNGPTSREGRVEVYRRRSWGTVCDDNWDNRDASVVCRELGFSTDNAQAFPSARYGQGSGSILLDDVQCNGNEDSLEQCGNVGWNRHNCYHSEDAGVRCGEFYIIFEKIAFLPLHLTLISSILKSVEYSLSCSTKDVF